MMENKEMFGNFKDTLLKALAIELIQNQITEDEVVKKALEIISGMKEEPKQKVKFEDVPVNWNPLKTKGTKRQRPGTRLVLSDGLRKEGFYSKASAGAFLNRSEGYISSCIKNGTKILSFPDGKEWFIIEEA